MLGATSQGLFLLTASQWVLFLTGDRNHGPLILNLDAMPGSLREAAGDPISIHPDGIWFTKSRLLIPTWEANIWDPPPAKQKIPAPSVILARLEEVSQKIQVANDFPGLGTLRDLTLALQAKAPEQVADLLCCLLGYGNGLTPAGDDLALGLLLALNRWGHTFAAGLSLQTLNARLIHEARRRTTTLSANLIECAACGLADERLLSGLDGLLAGILDATTCAACFNSWGNSSGRSAFIGIKLAFDGLLCG